MATDFFVGESLVGEGNEVAHIDLIIGSKSGPAGTAFTKALANQKDGFSTLLAVVAPNLPAKLDTILFNKVTIKGVTQAVQMFGPAQAAVARAVIDSVESGVIPRDRLEDYCVLVGVFIHWEAEDAQKIYDYNYQATKESIERAMAGQPSAADVIAAAKTTTHPFASNAERPAGAAATAPAAAAAAAASAGAAGASRASRSWGRTLMRAALYVVSTIALLAVFLGVLSAAAHMTRSLDSDYKMVNIWGERGEGPGKFVYPGGLSVFNDEVYVVDVNSHLIQVFDLDGNYRRQFGQEGEGPGEFKRPWALYFHGGELYVAAYENNRIDVFDPDGTYKRSFGSLGTGDGEMEGPLALTVDGNDNIVIMDFYNHRVVRHTLDGDFIDAWGRADVVGISNDLFNYPLDVVTSRDGQSVFVLDSGNERIKVYGADGEYKFKWGGPFSRNIFFTYHHWFPFNGWFADPKAMTIDQDGKIYVADASNHRVQVFLEDGSFVTAFGEEGENEIGYSSAIDVTDDGRIYVLDQRNREIQEWRYQPGD